MSAAGGRKRYATSCVGPVGAGEPRVAVAAPECTRSAARTGSEEMTGRVESVLAGVVEERGGVVDGDGVPGASESDGGGETGDAGADDCDVHWGGKTICGMKIEE